MKIDGEYLALFLQLDSEKWRSEWRDPTV